LLILTSTNEQAFVLGVFVSVKSHINSVDSLTGQGRALLIYQKNKTDENRALAIRSDLLLHYNRLFFNEYESTCTGESVQGRGIGQ